MRVCPILIYRNVIRIAKPCNPKLLYALMGIGIRYTEADDAYEINPILYMEDYTYPDMVEEIMDIAAIFYDRVEARPVDGYFGYDYKADVEDESYYSYEGASSTKSTPPEPPRNAWTALRECVDIEDLRKFYYQLAKRYHPDVTKDDGKKMKLLNELFTELGVLK